MKSRRTLLLVFVCSLVAFCMLEVAHAEAEASSYMENIQACAFADGKVWIVSQRWAAYDAILHADDATHTISTEKRQMVVDALYLLDDEGNRQYVCDVSLQPNMLELTRLCMEHYEKTGELLVPNNTEDAERIAELFYAKGSNEDDKGEEYQLEKLLIQDNQLYLVGRVSSGHRYMVKQYVIDGDTVSPTENILLLQLDDREDDMIGSYYLSGDYLWILTAPYTIPTWHVVNLSTGKVKQTTLPSSYDGACAYQEGKLLCGIGSNEPRRQRLVTIDPETMALQDVGTLDLSDVARDFACFAYDRQYDRLYAVDGACVYLCNRNGSLQICAYLPQSALDSRNSALAFVEGDSFCLWDRDGENSIIQKTLTLTGDLTRPLTIYAPPFGAFNYIGDEIKAFALAYPDIPLRIENVVQTDAEIGQMLLTGGGADVYLLNTSSSLYRSMVRKGYFVDLADSAAVRGFVDDMFPHLASMVWDDQRLCGMPAMLECNAWCRYPEAMEHLGLTMEDMPHTYDELFDLISRWEDEWEDNDEDIHLFLSSEEFTQKDMLSYLMQEHAAYCESKQIPLTFDTPEFRHMLERYLQEALPFLRESPDNPKKYLMANIGLPFLSDSRERMLMSYTAEDTPHVIASLHVYVINPASPHREDAMKLVEFMTEHLEPYSLYPLQPAACIPVRKKWAARQLKDATESLASFKADVEEQEYAMDWQLESIGALEDEIASLANRGWSVSPGQADNWLQVVEHVVPAPVLPASLDTAMDRLLDGQLDAEGFIREVERMVVMERMENE